MSQCSRYDCGPGGEVGRRLRDSVSECVVDKGQKVRIALHVRDDIPAICQPRVIASLSRLLDRRLTDVTFGLELAQIDLKCDKFGIL